MYARVGITESLGVPTLFGATTFLLLADGVSFLLLTDGVSLLQLMDVITPTTVSAHDARVSIVAIPAT